VLLAAALPFLVLGAWLYSVLDARVNRQHSRLAVMGSVRCAGCCAGARCCCVRRGLAAAPRVRFFLGIATGRA